MSLLASSGDVASPLANAFFYVALFVAVAYFGWRLYGGLKKEREDKAANEDAESADALDAPAEPSAADRAEEPEAGSAADESDEGPEPRRDS